MSETPAKSQDMVSSLRTSRKLFAAVGVLVVVFGGGAYFLRHDQATKLQSAPLKVPRLDSPAGGGVHTPLMDRTNDEAEGAAARQAEATGTSFASGITTHVSLPNGMASALTDTPAGSGQTSTKPQTKKAWTNPFTRTPGTGTSTKTTPPPASGLSAGVEAELLAAWSATPPSLEMMSPSDRSSGSQTNAATSPFTRTPPGSETLAGDAGPSGPRGDMAAASSTTQHGRLLLAAGRGVYGHSVLAVNSDLGGPVLVQLNSGPLVGDRVSGTFQTKSDRLVIKFNKLMIGDGEPISITAFATSPDTAETGVASDVDEHWFTRIVLPAAAAFAEGLGSALQSSNTTTVATAAGVTSFNDLSLPEQVGVGAGAAAKQFGQILQKATPQTATVTLDKGAPVGVVFADPVYAP